MESGNKTLDKNWVFMTKIKFQVNSILLRVAVGLATFGLTITADEIGQALIPDAADITHVEGRTTSGRELTVRDEGNSRSVTNVIPGRTRLRRFRDVLGVPAGDRKATLDFMFFNPRERTRKLSFAGFRAQTIPKPYTAEYRLPCRTSGGKFDLSWRRAGEGRDRGCEEGVRVGTRSGLSSLNFPESDQVSTSAKQLSSPQSILYCGARPRSRYSGLFQVSSGVTDDSCESVVRQCEGLSRQGECSLVSMGEWNIQDSILHTAFACSQGTLERRSTGTLMAQLLLNLMQQINANKLSNCAVNVYTSDEEIMTPGDGQAFVRVENTPTGLVLDVLIGEVVVRSVKSRLGKPLKAGQRYFYPDDTTSSINPKQVAQSPEVQDFLDPNQALSPGLPPEVTEDLAAQISDHRIALGLTPVEPLSSYYLRIVRGSGKITSSNVSAVRVGTSEDRVTGGYDPLNRKLTLDIAGRQVEMTLNAPLKENTPVGFKVTRVRPRYSGEQTVSQFQKLVENTGLIFNPQGGGTLRRVGDQIVGDFTVRSEFTQGYFNIRGNFSRFIYSSPRKEGNGLATGEFRLNFQYGTSSNLPNTR